LALLLNLLTFIKHNLLSHIKKACILASHLGLQATQQRPVMTHEHIILVYSTSAPSALVMLQLDDGLRLPFFRFLGIVGRNLESCLQGIHPFRDLSYTNVKMLRLAYCIVS